MFEELVKKRKSIRKFKENPIEREKIEKILQCARLSPSACNSQPYRFIVMSGEYKNKFCDSVFTGMFSSCSFVKKAPLIIAMVRTKTSLKMKIGNMVCDTDFSLIDLGIAGEHMVLAATDMGLGSLWVGWFDRKKAFEFLNLKKGENIEIIIAIGEKDEEPNERKKKSFEDIVEFRS
jgi:nitroreductase